MARKKQITSFISLSDEEVKGMRNLIQYETLEFWRKQNLNFGGRGQLMQDAMQFVWTEVLRMLHLAFDRTRGVKPQSFVKPRIKQILLRFMVKEKWIHQNALYKGRPHQPMPTVTGLRVRVKWHRAPNGIVPLDKILTS